MEYGNWPAYSIPTLALEILVPILVCRSSFSSILQSLRPVSPISVSQDASRTVELGTAPLEAVQEIISVGGAVGGNSSHSTHLIYRASKCHRQAVVRLCKIWLSLRKILGFVHPNKKSHAFYHCDMCFFA